MSIIFFAMREKYLGEYFRQNLSEIAFKTWPSHIEFNSLYLLMITIKYWLYIYLWIDNTFTKD
jgi:hypothetical protein